MPILGGKFIVFKCMLLGVSSSLPILPVTVSYMVFNWLMQIGRTFQCVNVASPTCEKIMVWNLDCFMRIMKVNLIIIIFLSQSVGRYRDWSPMCYYVI
jgi:hypothetical protein